MSDKGMQVPLSDLEGRWSVVCIDVKSYLAELAIFGRQKPSIDRDTPAAGTSKTKASISRLSDVSIDFTLSSAELCGKAMYKSVFVSDVPFEPKNMPKEMALLLGKQEKFDEKYGYKKLVNPTFVVPTQTSPQTIDAADPGNIRGRSSRRFTRTRSCD